MALWPWEEAGNFCCGWLFPVLQEEPRVQWPKHPGEATDRGVCHMTGRHVCYSVNTWQVAVAAHQSLSFAKMPLMYSWYSRAGSLDFPVSNTGVPGGFKCPHSGVKPIKPFQI